MAAVTLAEAKNYLRYDSADTSNDTALGIILDGGQRYIENFTGHILSERTVTETLAIFPTARATGELPYHELRWKPYKTATLTVAYLDSDLAAGTFTAFTLFAYSGAHRVIPNSAWPSAAYTGIVLSYAAGYANAAAVPDDLIHALAIYVGMSDEERGSPSSAGFQALDRLLVPYRLPVLA